MTDALSQRPLSSVHILLTEDCNLRCAYCFVQHNPNRMDWRTLERALDCLLEHGAPNLHITWFGGEPLLEWENLVRGTEYVLNSPRVQELKASFGAVVNGMMLTEERARRLAEMKV